MPVPFLRGAWVLALVSLGASAAPPAAPTAREARLFTERVNADLKRLYIRQQTAEWIKSNFITEDTERNAAALGEDTLAYLSQAQPEAARLSRAPGLDPSAARMLLLLRLAATLPAPNRAEARQEVAALATKLEALYGRAKACGPDGKPPCRDLTALEEVMDQSHDPQALLDAWRGWHDTARPLRPLYGRLVELGNEGARQLGFQDLAELWQSNYDLPPTQLRAELNRLWTQVEPLYQELHCYVRARLSKHYGSQVVPPRGPIPAHVLGNMWAQEWAEIYPLVEPFPGEASLDVTAALKAQGYTPEKMTRTAEGFFTSLGFDPLPKTFWERSLFVKPPDREVVCHASAWDVTYSDDLRIKMCIKPQEKDLVTLHHELGHLYYFHAYRSQPILFQQGANDGFHEAIGDAISLSVTPAYLKRLGLLPVASESPKALINQQLKDALERVAFLPFGRVVDQWRWEVFTGKISPERYNATWWELRRRFQGIVAPVPRTETDFDPGAKYHVAASVPYLRYFLARVLQFQFQRGMCRAAGFRGPLHQCSVAGSREAGKRLEAMLALGASRPWPDALEVLTGERQMDAGPLLEYFAPLRRWLAEQNQGQVCGW
jgi:peptidyl-dipeptidase A